MCQLFRLILMTLFNKDTAAFDTITHITKNNGFNLIHLPPHLPPPQQAFQNKADMINTIYSVKSVSQKTQQRVATITELIVGALICSQGTPHFPGIQFERHWAILLDL